jgi:hypothetical protein
MHDSTTHLKHKTPSRTTTQKNIPKATQELKASSTSKRELRSMKTAAKVDCSTKDEKTQVREKDSMVESKKMD